MTAGRAHSRRLRRFRLGVRVAAVLSVLLAIGADIAADSRCRPRLPARSGVALEESVPPTPRDPCDRGCVPDCYCCSQSVTPRPTVLPQDRGPVTPAVRPEPDATPPGVHPVPYHPPLALV